MNPTTQLIEAIEQTLRNEFLFGEASTIGDKAQSAILLAIADAVDAQNGEDETGPEFEDDPEGAEGVLTRAGLSNYIKSSQYDWRSMHGRNEERARWRQWAGELRKRAKNDQA